MEEEICGSEPVSRFRFIICHWSNTPGRQSNKEVLLDVLLWSLHATFLPIKQIGPNCIKRGALRENTFIAGSWRLKDMNIYQAGKVH